MRRIAGMPNGTGIAHGAVTPVRDKGSMALPTPLSMVQKSLTEALGLGERG